VSAETRGSISTDLAHGLGLIVVAEGVETAATLALVREIGCDLGQGSHLGRPCPSSEMTALLREAPRLVPRVSRSSALLPQLGVVASRRGQARASPTGKGSKPRAGKN